MAIARILKAQGIPLVPARPTSWETFLRAHWGAIAGADFFTTDVWTWRGLVTYYTVFVIELATRRVQIVGSRPHPNDAFMLQAAHTMTALDDGALAHCRVLICDRDRKWSAAVRRLLEESAIRVAQTPFQAPNCNAHAERFVRSVKEECLNRVIPLGERPAISTDILDFRGRVLGIQAGKGRLRENGAHLGHGSAPLLERPRDPLVRAVASRRTGPRVPLVGCR